MDRKLKSAWKPTVADVSLTPAGVQVIVDHVDGSRLPHDNAAAVYVEGDGLWPFLCDYVERHLRRHVSEIGGAALVRVDVASMCSQFSFKRGTP